MMNEGHGGANALGQAGCRKGIPVSVHVSPKRFRDEDARRQGAEEDACMCFDQAALRTQLDAAEALGITHFNTFANFDVRWSQGEQEPIAEYLAAYLRAHPAMQMSSFHYVGSVYEEDPCFRELALDQMVQAARLFGPCHPGCFVMHPGVFGEGRFKANLLRYRTAVERHGRAAVMEEVAAGIRVFADEAARFGARTAVENLYGGRVYSSMDELVELVERVDRDNVGYCLDIGHAHADSVDIPLAIHRLGNKIYELHVHDNRGTDEHLPVGFGIIDWVPIIRALHEVGYAGTAAFEFFQWPGEGRSEGMGHAAALWKSLERLACEGYSYFSYL